MEGRRLDSHVMSRATLMNRQVLQMQGMPQLAVQLLASQEGPCSRKLISAALRIICSSTTVRCMQPGTLISTHCQKIPLRHC